MTASGLKSFYMIRLKDGLWEPKRKISNLAKAMDVAYRMAEHHKTRAYVIQTVASVEIVDNKPVWTDRTPIK